MKTKTQLLFRCYSCSSYHNGIARFSQLPAESPGVVLGNYPCPECESAFPKPPERIPGPVMKLAAITLCAAVVGMAFTLAILAAINR